MDENIVLPILEGGHKLYARGVYPKTINTTPAIPSAEYLNIFIFFFPDRPNTRRRHTHTHTKNDTVHTAGNRDSGELYNNTQGAYRYRGPGVNRRNRIIRTSVIGERERRRMTDYETTIICKLSIYYNPSGASGFGFFFIIICFFVFFLF